MITLDPSGRPVDARFLLAAEWVDVLASAGARGADPTELELFATNFSGDAFALRCPDCQERIRALYA